MRGLAQLADDFGSGELRVTVWQNIVLPNVSNTCIDAAVASIRNLGYDVDASAITGCVVACTGNACDVRFVSLVKQEAQVAAPLPLRQAVAPIPPPPEPAPPGRTLDSDGVVQD